VHQLERDPLAGGRVLGDVHCTHAAGLEQTLDAVPAAEDLSRADLADVLHDGAVQPT
jgi:hypothetical protein